MATHHVTLAGLSASLRALGSRAPAAVEDALREVGEMLAGPVIQHEIAAAGAVDQGQYKASWTSSPVSGGAVVRSSAPQATFIERGRGPGPVPDAPIIAWMDRKGIDPSLLFVIKRKIAASGTEPKWVLRKATESIKPLVVRIVKRALEAAA